MYRRMKLGDKVRVCPVEDGTITGHHEGVFLRWHVCKDWPWPMPEMYVPELKRKIKGIECWWLPDDGTLLPPDTPSIIFSALGGKKNADAEAE